MKKVLAILLAAMMLFSLMACGGQGEPNETKENAMNTDVTASNSDDTTTASTEKPIDTEESETDVTVTTEENTTEVVVSDSMRAEFKEAMDSYEEFMDEYVAFMKKYKENPSDMSLLADYADYLSEYAEFVADFEKWDAEEMNAVELAYYIDVQARVSKKLLEAT